MTNAAGTEPKTRTISVANKNTVIKPKKKMLQHYSEFTKSFTFSSTASNQANILCNKNSKSKQLLLLLKS